jgi:pyruvate dehydrogenase E2 component (dihydrolipoamide acetyltransferase)
MNKITMPQAGQTMEEGTILCWRKQEGEQVRKGEVLLEIETDKANVEVESDANGILRKILCPDGTTVPVLAPIAILAGPEEDLTGSLSEARAELKAMLGANAALIEALGLGDAGAVSAPEAPRAVQQDMQPLPAAEAPSAAAAPGVKASPAARKVAQERGLDLGGLMPGSGPGGRILSTDVEKAAPAAGSVGGIIRRPLAGMRRAIARNLVLSKQTIPHFYMRLTLDAGALFDFYRARKAQYPCTLNDVVALACARVVQEFPAFRSRIEGEELVEHPTANIGIAVGMEDGLRVPVIEGAERMSLRQLAGESQRVIEAAQRGKLEGAGRGVFTITNLGMFGVEEFAAIVNPPEAGILAIGALREAVLVKDGALRAGRVMTLTLSADHRVVDGLLAAKFLGRLKALLEAPESLGQ